MPYMPGSSSSPGPVLTHVIENIADGVFWLQCLSVLQWLQLKCSTHGFPTCLLSQRTPVPLTARWSNWPILYHKAPAKSLSSHGQALQAELRCDPGVALHPSTSCILKGGTKNSSRQYKRAVKRFGFSLSLGHASPQMVFDSPKKVFWYKSWILIGFFPW